MAGSALAETKSLHVPAAYGEPPDGWTWSRLDDVSEGVFDCPHSTPKLTDTGPFVVRTQDIITGVFRTDQAGRVSEEIYAERIARVTPSRGDLLYSREGTYFGIAAEVPPKTRVCLGQRMVLIRPDKRRLDFSFLCHWLNSPIMAAHIHGYRDGTVAERLNLPTIRALPILIPPLAEQKAIASILGALDDKIELNRRMNATLEGMARALFQSWFVDFDPVRAKLDGRKPEGLDKATAALFTDAFEESSLGPVPKGWELGRLDDALTLQRGFDLPTPDRTHGKYPVMAASGPNGCHDKFMVRGPGVTTGRSGVLGRVFFIHGDFWPLNTSLWVKEFKRVSPAYAFHLLRGLDFEIFNSGSAVPTLNRNHVHNLPVVMPPKIIVEAFDDQVTPLMKRQTANEDESRTLATLRDTLLPKLLSGELSVASSKVKA